MAVRERLPWELHITSATDGRLLSVQTFIACCLGHLFLLLFFLPASVTFFTSNKLSSRPLNRLAIKTISLVFDTIAVVGSIKEFIETTMQEGTIKDNFIDSIMTTTSITYRDKLYR